MIEKSEAGLIVSDYRLAKRPEEQILIMAQTHATSTAEIRKILYDAGVYKVGEKEVRRALQLLQEGGKNKSLGGLRLWLSCFKGCGAKEVRRVLKDYHKHPWADPIPKEEFEKAFGKKEDDTVVVNEEAPVAAAPEFSETEQSMILYGLHVLLSERTTILAAATAEVDDRRHELEAAQHEFDVAQQKLEDAQTCVAEVEQLIKRIGG